MQSVDFDQGTRYSNDTQLKGLQKYQSGKTEQKVPIKSSCLPMLYSRLPRSATSPWQYSSSEKTG